MGTKGFFIHFLDGMVLYLGKNTFTQVHSHHALEIKFTFGTKLQINANSKAYNTAQTYIIPPNLTHQTIVFGEVHGSLFLEPTMWYAQQLVSQYSLQNEPLEITQASTLSLIQALSKFLTEENINHTQLTQTLNKIVESLLPQKKAVVTEDERITKAKQFIEKSLDNTKIKLADIAQEACLSESRLSHLFKHQTGIPVSKYILWCRIKKAVQAVLSQMDFTEAAHSAGFSDSAHFSRTFSKMFGNTPSSVLSFTTLK